MIIMEDGVLIGKIHLEYFFYYFEGENGILSGIFLFPSLTTSRV